MESTIYFYIKISIPRSRLVEKSGKKSEVLSFSQFLKSQGSCKGYILHIETFIKQNQSEV